MRDARVIEEERRAFAGRKACVSFSGGKDSCLALWRARETGVDVCALINVLEESGERNRSHGVPRALLQAQADALGVELIAPAASWREYESRFISTLRELKGRGIDVAVFGDIDLQAHRDWEEKACASVGITPFLPLWQQGRLELARKVLDLGFRALIVCTDSRYLDESFCGREYNAELIADLPAGVDTCGENGEFHTFVVDGPMFQRPVPCRVTAFEDYTSPPELGSVRYRFARLA